MNNYKANVRDIEFNLFEVFNLGEVYGRAPFENTDEEVARASLKEADKFANDVFGELYEEGDRVGCQFNEGKITTPPGCKEAVEKFLEDSWQLMDVSGEDGGMNLPRSLVSGVQELFTAANPALFIYTGCSLFANIIKKHGTEEQIDRFAPNLLTGKWGGTMCMTEADAGSDVGAVRTKAKRIAGDLYSIEGTKRFITGGEQDLTENIIHLLLARVEGAPPGTKGLSMFIIPKIRVNDDGSLGEPNDVVCAGMEHKMGFNASATCQMVFGENGDCHGYLLGGVENKGMRQMFTLIHDARIWTGVKAMSLASAAYLNALEYTKERVQGVDMREMMNKSAPRVPILRHPDVRRMLMNQKSKVEAMRILILKTSVLLDEVRLAGGEENAPRQAGMIEILTPVIKAYCSEESFFCINDALQCLGGSGYCRDYPIELYMRDAKITTIYEGTTHIQAMDLVGRKLLQDGGASYSHLMTEIVDFLSGAADDETLGSEVKLMHEAAEAVKSQSDMLLAYILEDIYLVGLFANHFLFSLGELICGKLLLEQARVAKHAMKDTPEGQSDRNFYSGKISVAKYFVNNIVPCIFTRSRLMAMKDTSVVDIGEASL